MFIKFEMRHGRVSAFLLFCVLTNTCFLEVQTRNNDPVVQAEEDIKAKLEFDSVRKIHIHLDDDKNGDVDFKESKEFLQQELHMQDSKRHSEFHHGDGSITVDDLWKAWQNNEVSKWTSDQVVDWLKSVVHLPQYADIFMEMKINGHQIPRLAASDDNIFFNELGISNVIHRKKIALKAMDAVLFGAPRDHNYVKDLLLGLAVLIALGSFWFSNSQKRKAQKQIGVMMKDIEYLQQAEKNLTSLQDRLQQAETSRQVIQQEKHQLENNLKQEIEMAKREAHRLRTAREDQSEEIHTRLKLAEDELVQVREALRKAEKEVDFLSSPDVSSSLEKWLQITYQKEVKHFVHRRSAAFKKMEIAKDACDKINKKRNSVFGSLRLVHDQNMDEIDQKIFSARSSLAEVTNELEELQHRWQQIGLCCRLDIGVDSCLMGDVTADQAGSSSLGHALAMCGKAGTLGSLRNDSARNSLPRVATCPALEALGDRASLSSIDRQTSAPPFTKTSKDNMFEIDGSHLSLDSPDIITHADTKLYKNCIRLEKYDNHNNETLSVESDNETRGSCSSLQHNDITENGKGRKKHFTEGRTSSSKKKWWTRSKRAHHDTENDRDRVEFNTADSS